MGSRLRDKSNLMPVRTCALHKCNSYESNLMPYESNLTPYFLLLKQYYLLPLRRTFLFVRYVIQHHRPIKFKSVSSGHHQAFGREVRAYLKYFLPFFTLGKKIFTCQYVGCPEYEVNFSSSPRTYIPILPSNVHTPLLNLGRAVAAKNITFTM